MTRTSVPQRLRAVPAKGPSPLSDDYKPPAPKPAVSVQRPLKHRQLANGKTRKPFGRNELKLAYDIRPGYVGHLFMDLDARVQRAVEAGYEHVKDADGNPIKSVGGTDKRGQPAYLYLMEIPKEFHDEDFAEKQANLDEIDHAIYGGTFNEQEGDRRYVPKSTPITMRVQKGRVAQS